MPNVASTSLLLGEDFRLVAKDLGLIGVKFSLVGENLRLVSDHWVRHDGLSCKKNEVSGPRRFHCAGRAGVVKNGG
jgi:hypothetical protein